ncbi:MAG: hypothetical protein K2N87_12235 [Eubacterium sp.]|nr:hypothetical protein [Eubacterium sp.]
MDELFEKIYRELICNEREMYEFGRNMENEVLGMITGYKDQMNEEDLERLTEQVDDIASSARQGGFYCGVRFAVRGLVKLLADGKE